MMELELSQGQIAIVDDDCPTYITDCKWCAKEWEKTGRYYAVRTDSRPRKHLEYLHRAIMGIAYKDPRVVEFIDTNTLNCQRSNLRVSNHSAIQLNAFLARKKATRQNQSKIGAAQ